MDKVSELVLIGFDHGFSSNILTRARRKSESNLPYGALFPRSNRQDLPKRQMQYPMRTSSHCHSGLVTVHIVLWKGGYPFGKQQKFIRHVPLQKCFQKRRKHNDQKTIHRNMDRTDPSAGKKQEFSDSPEIGFKHF